MSDQFALFLALCSLLALANSLYTGEFQSEVWIRDDAEVDDQATVQFIVAMEMHDVEHMHHTLLDLSNPRSANYGKYLSLDQISSRYGPSQDERNAVEAFFANMEGSTISPHKGEMFVVSASVASIQYTLNTELGWVRHAHKRTEKRSLRTLKPITIPEHLHDLISFVSVNVPVNHAMPRAAKRLATRKTEAAGVARPLDGLQEDSEPATVNISPGNKEALVMFKPLCGIAATSTNEENPPCASNSGANTPTFTVAVSTHANIMGNTYLTSQEPMIYTVPSSTVYCYNTDTSESCNGSDGSNCSCIAKIANLPMYTQLRVNITSSYPNESQIQTLGVSNLFALTDVATAHFLSSMYSIPQGLSVQHGSNQSVVEFYGEFFSNTDLAQFLSLSGLPNATIPVENVYGDLANDQAIPGGEAQLDVEYIMALAPNAATFFYSFSDLNPYDPVNEGFLAYLTYVSNQEYPPLVHSLSYGDDMANIFNSSNNGSLQYGQRCDQEFLKMGLRGITFLFSSGDDGIGGSMIEDDQQTACSASRPEWPTGSPYVTSVGATQMTDKFLPICEEEYSVSSAYPSMPEANQLNFQCSGTAETVCSSTFGGVITSGGGFSDIANRTTTAPWQTEAVDAYLSASNAAAYPPTSYFNPYGRGYPDVATYGSNYFVYLRNRITRESGTSASAPVFAAMVTLWNDMRLAYGLPPMGFVAPFLYYAFSVSPDAFHDITTGNNACGAGYSIETVPCCDNYFSASSGWDAVSGLGSPNFEILSNLVLNNNTAFPNLGSFPIGQTESTKEQSSSVDDGNNYRHITKDVAESGLAIAIVAAVFAVSTLIVYLKPFHTSIVEQGNEDDSTSRNPMSS